MRRIAQKHAIILLYKWSAHKIIFVTPPVRINKPSDVYDNMNFDVFSNFVNLEQLENIRFLCIFQGSLGAHAFLIISETARALSFLR